MCVAATQEDIIKPLLDLGEEDAHDVEADRVR